MKAIMDIRLDIEVKDEKLEGIGNVIDLAKQGLCDVFEVDATLTAINDYDEIILFNQDFSDQVLHMLCAK